MKLDPATWREAARQLREDELVWPEGSEARLALRVMAHRFEAEAKAAEMAAASTATADSLAADEVEHEGRIAMRWSEIIAKAEPRPFRAFRMGYHVARRFYEAKAAERKQP